MRTGFLAMVILFSGSGCFGLAMAPRREPQKEVPLVQASESPRLLGKGWYCFEYRSNRGESSTTCLRTLEECRSSAASLERGSHGGSTTNPLRFKAGMCTSQATAYCRYIWYDPSGGEHKCFGVLSDCQADVNSFGKNASGGYLKHSECAAY